MTDTADHLHPNTMLPQLSLTATDGSDVCLAALPRRTLLIVYPWTGRPGLANPPNWDNIPGAHGSTPELEGFRDLETDFAKRGVRLYALSTQTTDYQGEMVRRLRIPFPALSDAERMFSRSLGLPSFETGGESYLKRLTLVIANGRIETVFYPVAEPARHAVEILSWLAVNKAG